MRALIFCAGVAGRWTGPAAKQLVMIDSEPLLERTIRQFTGRGIPCTVVSNNDIFEREGAEFFRPGETHWLVESILKTEGLWDDRTLFLLGDVIFSDAAVDTICAEKKLAWFGRANPSPITGGRAEVFAMSCPGDDRERFAKAMQVGFDEAEESGEAYNKAGTPYGSVWQPYRYLEGLPLNKHQIARGPNALFREVNDFTDDFDSYEHYLFWLRQWKRRIVRPVPVQKLEELEDPPVEVTA